MPRRIDLVTGDWTDHTQQSPRELGSGIEMLSTQNASGLLYDLKSLPDVRNHCGSFEWVMVSDFYDPQKENDDRRPIQDQADEIYQWVTDNIKGKWFLWEAFACSFSQADSTYYIEDESDRQAFQKKWGDVFEYKPPTAEFRPALIEAEQRIREHCASTITTAWEKTRQVLPLTPSTLNAWSLVSVRLGNEPRLVMVPSSRSELKDIVGIPLPSVNNEIRHMVEVLEGADDVVITDPKKIAEFVALEERMFGFCSTAQGICRGGEINRSYVASIGTPEMHMSKDYASRTERPTLDGLRELYAEGADIVLRVDTSFLTFNRDSDVAYRWSDRGGLYVTNLNRGSGIQGYFTASMTGCFSKASGLPHGQWQRADESQSNIHSDSFNGRAQYHNGQLIEGTLNNGHGSNYQPAAPKTYVLGS